MVVARHAYICLRFKLRYESCLHELRDGEATCFLGYALLDLRA